MPSPVPPTPGGGNENFQTLEDIVVRAVAASDPGCGIDPSTCMIPSDCACRLEAQAALSSIPEGWAKIDGGWVQVSYEGSMHRRLRIAGRG